MPMSGATCARWMMRHSAISFATDRIDILVDLTMHMADGRPLLFARKPAPIQIAWLAYPGTTGIGAMDYRFSDPRLDPAGFDEPLQRAHHPAPRFVLVLRSADRSTRASTHCPHCQRGYLTLGCLNNPCKLTDHTLRLWGGVMRSAARRAASAHGPARPPSPTLARSGWPRRASRRNASNFVAVSAARRLFALVSRHRSGSRYISLQRPYHQPGFALDGCARRHAGGQHQRRSGRPQPAIPHGPARARRRIRRGVRRHRGRARPTIWPGSRRCAGNCARASSGRR